MNQPLAGIKMIDLSQVIAGPYGSGLLSHLGSETTKIEILTGEQGRSLAGSFFGLNRGKRSLPLNLQSEEGKQILLRLAAEADVFIENFRPGVVERLGIDYATLSALNPRLIYVSISAFGAGGPYAHRGGFDPLLQAMTGVERTQGGAENPPVFLRIAITDYTTGMMQAAAITLALYNRERTGKGEHLQFSLLRSGLFINAEAFTRFEGRKPRRLPDRGQNGFSALDRMYRASDAWVFLLVEGDDERWTRLVSLPRFSALAADSRFASAAARVENDGALAAAIEAVIAGDTAENWLAELEAAGVPSAPVLPDYDRRFFEDVQPIINGYLVYDDHIERGRVEHGGNYLRFSAAETQLEGRAAPVLGQHVDEVLAELGYDPESIARLRAQGITI